MIGSGKIVKSGLVGSWDAADENSYPGSGAIWYDLMGSNPATLVNGPTFDTTNVGTITVDGSNDRITVPSASGDFSFTGEMFMEIGFIPKEETHVRPIVSTHADNPFRLIMASTTGTSGEFYFNWNLNVDGTTETVSSTFYVEDEPYIIQCGYNGAQVFMYMNGVKQSDTEAATGDIDTLTKDIAIGGSDGYSPARYANLGVGFLRLYNRCLTDEEILKNYDTQKTRFGL